MFDIGFLEIMVILVIALIVIGPERMPEVARKVGSFIGKTRNFVNSVKSQSEFSDTINDFKKSIDLEEQQRQITSISDELNKGLSVGLDNVNLDDIHRPFGQGTAADLAQTETEGQRASSQFNKAPAQPNLPKPQTPDHAAQTKVQAEPAETVAASQSQPQTSSQPAAEKTAQTDTAKS